MAGGTLDDTVNRRKCRCSLGMCQAGRWLQLPAHYFLQVNPFSIHKLPVSFYQKQVLEYHPHIL